MTQGPDAEHQVQLRPILEDDIAPVAAFLHRELNSRIDARQWAQGIRTPWIDDAPNHGFMLVSSGEVVGVNLAFYSSRTRAGAREHFCNLGALCVLANYRSHALRLVRAILKQRTYHFTDLSPSGNVIELNRRLGFQHLDTAASMVINHPWPPTRGVALTSDPRTIAAVLTGPDRHIFEDHRNSPAAQHTLLREGDQQCYVITRRDRRKGLALFASVLHIGNPDLFAQRSRNVFAHLFRATGAPITLLEDRISHFRPSRAIRLSKPRPKMFKSATLPVDQIDYLYSELTQIKW